MKIEGDPLEEEEEEEEEEAVFIRGVNTKRRRRLSLLVIIEEEGFFTRENRGESAQHATRATPPRSSHRCDECVASVHAYSTAAL